MAARKQARRKTAKKAAKKRPKPRKPPKKAPRKPRKKAPRKPKPRTTTKPPEWVPREFTIILTPDDLGVDSAPSTSRSRRDLVRWVNRGSVTRALTFKDSMWPFEGNPCDIVVPVGGQTGWYRIETRPEEHGKVVYDYSPDPPFDPNGPPGDPVVDAGD
jgi:hypothetical protein